MKKIEFVKIEFKNFLSYGNNWTTVDFKKGITIIQGEDINSGKSNGSGKTSCVESIAFALFGYTIKDIKKADIVNWINGTGCEVKLTINIGEDTYLFNRSLKPNKFTVHKNGSKLPQLSTARLFQDEIEDTIIGMNFKTFKNLIYFSPNNTISILSAGKEEKRQFLESLFDLGIFSDLNKKVNEKLSSNKASIYTIESDNKHNTTMIESLTEDIVNIAIPDVKAYKKELMAMNLKLESLEESPIKFDEGDLMGQEKNLVNISKLNGDMKVTIAETKSKIINAQALIENLDISAAQKKHIVLTNRLLELGDVDVMKSDITTLEKSRDELKDHLKELISLKISKGKEKVVAEKDITVIETEIQGIKNAYDNTHNSNTLDGISTCPTCLQDIDHEMVADHFKKECDDLNAQLIVKYGIQEKMNIDLNIINNGIESLDTEKIEAKEKLETQIDKITSIEKDIAIIVGIKEQIDNLPDVVEMEKVVAGHTETKEFNKKLLEQFQWSQEMLTMDIESLEQDIKIRKDAKVQYIDHNDKIKVLKGNILNTTTKISEYEVLIKKQEKVVLEKKNKIVVLKEEMEVSTKKQKSMTRLLDHLMYIKKGLSDDNIKKYAIGAALPYLNSRVNEYLSDAGIPYHAKINGFLDVEIRGLGVGVISIGALSGGEMKLVDTAILLALNDIAALQSSSILDIFLLDEILDSSVDSITIDHLMGIIKSRQIKTNSSVYIVTHRQEVQGMCYDHLMKISKKDGFSSIESL